MDATPIKSPDYTAHGAITGPLTNSRIDYYALLGRYGTQRQAIMLARVKSGKCRRFDDKIKSGHFGQDAITALTQRKPKGTREAPLTNEQLVQRAMELLGLA